jgi:hypothetical protein
MSKEYKYEWDNQLYYNLTDSTYIDLNALRSESCFEDFKVYPRLNMEYAEAKGIHGHNDSLIKSLKEFLNKYAPDGRNTVVRSLWQFFVFQSDDGYEVGGKFGLEDFKLKLISDVRTQKIKQSTARSKYSIVNRYLLFCGQIKKNSTLRFTKKNRNDSDVHPYQKKEFLELLNILFYYYDTYSEIIIDHIEKSKKGIRFFKIGSLPAPILTYTNKHVNNKNPITFEVIGSSNCVKIFNLTSVLIFAFFTWGNTKQIIELDMSDIKLDEDGIDTGYIYKGRAFKFVRLSIGKSSFSGDRSGYRWFKKFIETRGILKEYLEKIEGWYFDGDPLFFAAQGKSNDEFANIARQIAKYDNYVINQGTIMEQMSFLDMSLDSYRISRIRKTCEQYADSELKSPFVIIEKAQHEWKTYQKNYSRGNPIDSKIDMSSALNELHNDSIRSLPIEEKNKELLRFGLEIVTGSEDDVESLINGFGCKKSLPETEIEKKFITKQVRLGRDPKACADFANCVICSKCRVIEDVDAVYKLLSFKHAIEYGKVIYNGSDAARKRYKEILSSIEDRISFINEKVVDAAIRKIGEDGYSKIWEV